MSFDDCNDNCGGDDDGDDDDDLVLNRRASQPGSCSKGVLHSKSGSGSATGWISIFQICSTMLQLYISNVFHNDTIVPATASDLHIPNVSQQRWIFEDVTQLMCGGHVKHLFLLWDPLSVRAAFLMNDAASRG